MMRRIKIIQIGISHEHAPGKMIALRRLPDYYDIVGLVDDSKYFSSGKFVNWKPEFGDGIVQLTLDEALNYPGLEAVTVEVPNHELVPIALHCLERNLAIHMDKPAGEDLAQFRKLLDGCKARKLPFQMGFMFRTNPAFLLAQKLIRNGALGEVFALESDMSHNYGGYPYEEYLGNFHGGIMYNLGCHLIDFAVTVLGLPERVVPFLKSVGDVPEQIRNSTVAVMEYPHATATFRASIGEFRGSGRRAMKICGTKGTLEFRPLEVFAPNRFQVELYLDKGNAEYSAGFHLIECPGIADRHEEQLRELAQIICGERPNPCEYEHDYQVAELTLAASGFATRYQVKDSVN